LGYIKRLKLENFQSHRESEIEFDPGLTVILGQTDQGKSAIIRALKWALYNEPRGSDFVTVGCKKCRVTLEMQDGTIIIRERDGNRNRYILKKGDQEEIFEGFGNTVPLEIIQAHGIPKLHLYNDSSSTVNLAEQLEAPFLISESGSNRAKALGQLVGIHIIDEAQRSVIKDLLDNQQRQKTINKRIEELNNELKEYEDLPEFESKISAAKDIIFNLKEKISHYNRLCQLKASLVPTFEGIKNAEKILKTTSSVDEAKVCILECTTKLNIMTNLIKIKKKLTEIKEWINAEQSNLQKLKDVDLIEKHLSEALEKNNRLRNLTSYREMLVRTDQDLDSESKILSETRVLPATETIKTRLDSMIEKLNKYVLIRDELKRLEDFLVAENNVLNFTKNVEDADNAMMTLTQKSTKLIMLNHLKNKLEEINLSMQKGKRYIGELAKELNEMASNYSEVLKKLAICPTCFSPIDVNTAQRIAADLLKNDVE